MTREAEKYKIPNRKTRQGKSKENQITTKETQKHGQHKKTTKVTR